jgi:hypothetical protein
MTSLLAAATSVMAVNAVMPPTAVGASFVQSRVQGTRQLTWFTRSAGVTGDTVESWTPADVSGVTISAYPYPVPSQVYTCLFEVTAEAMVVGLTTVPGGSTQFTPLLLAQAGYQYPSNPTIGSAVVRLAVGFAGDSFAVGPFSLPAGAPITATVATDPAYGTVLLLTGDAELTEYLAVLRTVLLNTPTAPVAGPTAPPAARISQVWMTLADDTTTMAVPAAGCSSNFDWAVVNAAPPKAIGAICSLSTAEAAALYAMGFSFGTLPNPAQYPDGLTALWAVFGVSTSVPVWVSVPGCDFTSGSYDDCAPLTGAVAFSLSLAFAAGSPPPGYTGAMTFTAPV